MMNTNLHDIQSDIQRLASQQNQIQAQTIQAQQLMHAQQIANILSQQQYGSQHNINTTGYRPLNSSFGSSPHLSQSPQYNTRPPSRDQHIQNIQYVNEQGQYIQANQPQYSYPVVQQQPQGNHPLYARENSQTQLIQNNQFSNQYQQYHQDSNHYRDPYGYQQDQQPPQVNNNTFYLHDQQQSAPPQPTQRRTWAQSAQMQQQRQQQQQEQPEMTTWSTQNNKIDSRTWKSPSNSSSNDSGKSSGGFMLHQNGGSTEYTNPEQSYQTLFPVHANSPQHRQHRQISQIMSNEYNRVDNRMQMTPPDDAMAPQSISFIADDDGGEVDEIQVNNHTKPMVRPRTAPFNQHQLHDQREGTPPHSTKLELNLAKLNITSGNRTYRIPSPTRPAINPNSFQVRNSFLIAFELN